MLCSASKLFMIQTPARIYYIYMYIY